MHISGYLVYYTDSKEAPNQQWSVEGVLGDRLHAPIRDLIPNTKYYFKVQTRNSKGYGPYSDVVEFQVGKIPYKNEKGK